jgi:HTH-type transcriptional regulator/antitoxin HigA
MIEIRPLRTVADYAAALKAIAKYFENEPVRGIAAAAERFDLLARAVANYESKH